MSEKQTSLLRFFGNRSAPFQESDVDDEGPITSKNVKGHIAGIVESHHFKIGKSGCCKTSSWFSLIHYCNMTGLPRFKKIHDFFHTKT